MRTWPRIRKPFSTGDLLLPIPYILAITVAFSACGNPQKEKMKHYQKGLILSQHGRCADAITEYQKALKIDPQMAEAQYELGNCYNKLQYQDQAIRAYDAARTLDPRLTIKALAGIAEMYASSGELELSEETCRNALETDSQNVDVLVLLGKLKLKEEKSAEARSLFEKVLAVNPNHVESHMVLAEIAMRERKYDLAEEHLGKIITEIDPKNTAAALSLATIYRFTNREDKAIGALQQILKDNPNNVRAQGALAETYFSMNRLDDARKEAETYLRLAPQDAQAHLLLGTILVKQNDYDQAVIHLTTAANSSATASAQVHYLLGLALKQAGKPAQAISSLQKALAMEPGNTQYRLALAQTMLAEGSFDEAQREITSVLSTEPENEYARQLAVKASSMRQTFEHMDSLLASEGLPEEISDNFKAGLNAFQTGDLQKAQSLCEDLIKAAPNSPLPLNLLGLVYLKQNKLEEALRYFMQATNVNPKFAASYVNMGNVYIAIESYDQAIQAFKKSIELSPKDQFVRLTYVRALASMGRNDAAEDFLNKLIQENPDQVSYRMLLVDLLVSANRYSDVRKQLAQILKIDPKNAGAAYVLAETLAKEGNAKGAAAGFETLLRPHPASGPLRSKLALCYLALSLPEKAQEILDGHQKADDKNPSGMLVNALLMEQRGRSGDAEKTLTELRANAPDETAYELMLANIRRIAGSSAVSAEDQNSHLSEAFRKSFSQLLSSKSLEASDAYELNLGIALSEVRWHLLGIERLEKVSSNAGPNAALSEMIGSLWEKEGQPDKAASCYQSAVVADPSYWPAYYRLGLLSFRKGQTAQAEENLRSGLKYQPNSLIILTSLAQVCQTTGNDADAIKFYRKINELRPNLPPVMNNLAWLLSKDRNTLDEALGYAQSAVTAQPLKAEVRDTLGWIFFQKNEYGRAREQLDKAVFLNSLNPSIRYHRGMTYLKLGEKAKALEDFKQAAASPVSFPEKELNESTLRELS